MLARIHTHILLGVAFASALPIGCDVDPVHTDSTLETTDDTTWSATGTTGEPVPVDHGASGEPPVAAPGAESNAGASASHKPRKPAPSPLRGRRSAGGTDPSAAWRADVGVTTPSDACYHDCVTADISATDRETCRLTCIDIAEVAITPMPRRRLIVRPGTIFTSDPVLPPGVHLSDDAD